MRDDARAFVALTILTSVCIASCYAQYSWLSVDAGVDSNSSERAVVFSETERRAAINAAAAISLQIGLRPSPMAGMVPSKPTPENPFRELALFQGSGDNSNLILTVALKDDGTVLRFWISDLDHSHPTELVVKLVSALKEMLERTFPDRKITVGGGRKLRIYAG
jgi:hypothetical protein